MQYEMIDRKADFTKPLEVVFNNRGIPYSDMKLLLNPNSSMQYDFRLLENIQKAAERIIEAINNEEKIFLQVDSDADGYTSAALMWLILKRHGVIEENVTYRFHEGKQHGIVVDTVPDECTLILIPDAGSNQFEEHKQLREMGKTVIVIDHHDTEKFSEDAIVVNNQFKYPNKSLSGVGVVYKLAQAMDFYNCEIVTEEDPIMECYLDLVAVGIVADMMDVTNLETMYYIQKGMANLYNPFFKAIVSGNQFKLGGDMSPMKISFYIAPLINAMVRTGNQEQKRTMFNAMIHGNEEDSSAGGFGAEISFAEVAVKVCQSVKRKQDKLRDEGMVKMYMKIQKKGLEKNQIIVGNALGISPNLRGLIANQLMAAFGKPVLMLSKDQKTKVWSGSGRGADGSDFRDFKDYLNSTGLFEYAEGHQSAFGAAIKDENMEKFIEQSNEDLKEYTFSKSYKIDLEYTANQISPNVLSQITLFKNHYAKGFEEPYILVKNVVINEETLIVMGKNPDKPSVKIKVGEVNFVIFSTTKEAVEELKEMKRINIIGRANENIWQDNVSYQIMVSHYEKASLSARDLF